MTRRRTGCRKGGRPEIPSDVLDVREPKGSLVCPNELAFLEQILDHPRTTRMPSIAIFGDSGMGRTMLMRKFCTDHPPGVDADTGQHRDDEDGD
jgi:hypothetical protein